MPKRFGYPRNEASRRDKVAQHEIITKWGRDIKSRNDIILSVGLEPPSGNAGENLLRFSEQFDNVLWTKGAPTTISADTSEVTDPKGGNNADKINDAGGSLYQGSIAVEPLTEYTVSFYARGATVDPAASFTINQYDETGSAFFGEGTVVELTSSWQRFTKTITTVADQVALRFYLNRSGAAGDAYVFGAQVEIGPIATVYSMTV